MKGQCIGGGIKGDVMERREDKSKTESDRMKTYGVMEGPCWLAMAADSCDACVTGAVLPTGMALKGVEAGEGATDTRGTLGEADVGWAALVAGALAGEGVSLGVV